MDSFDRTLQPIPYLLSEISLPCILQPLTELIQNVQIRPPEIVFADAYECKRYVQNFKVTNCGEESVWVRIEHPRSKVIHMEPREVKTFFLAPGMTITKHLYYVHKYCMSLHESAIPITINGKIVSLPIFIKVAKPLITLSENQVNFGVLDVGHLAEVRTIELHNKGKKTSQFTIDLSRNELELNVYPIHGTLRPNEKTTLYIELMSFTEGPFSKEFWIKTTPLQSLHVTAKFILPKIKLLFPQTYHPFFSIIDFPKTFYHCLRIKGMVIKNDSSMPMMFFVMVKNEENDFVPYSKMKNEGDLRYFEVNPPGGRLLPFEECIIEIGFFPCKIVKEVKSFALNSLRIIRINAKEQVMRIHSDIFETQNDKESLLSSTELLDEKDEYDLTTIVNPFFQKRELNHLDVCIYGEIEELRIKTIPDQFYLPNLEVDKMYTRVLYIENESSLPITLRNRKCSTTIVKPNRFLLNAKGKIEIEINIKIVIRGERQSNIEFDIFYSDDRITTNFASLVVKMTLSTNPALKRVKRVKTTILCSDDVETNLNTCIKPYVVDKSLLMNESRCFCPENSAQNKCFTCVCLPYREDCHTCPNIVFPSFLSLFPDHLMNIIVEPELVNLGKIAVGLICEGSFTLSNYNKFAIKIIAHSLKHNFFYRGVETTVESNETKLLTVLFKSHEIGKYCVPINVLINNTQLFKVIFIAEVIHKEVVIYGMEHTVDAINQFRYIKISNELNTCIPFEFHVDEKDCLKIYPEFGEIPARRNMICFFYTKEIINVNSMTILLSIDEGRSKEKITVFVDQKKFKIGFSNENLNFSNIPLNRQITDNFYLENYSGNYFYFKLESSLLPGLEVTPTEGLIEPKCNKLMTITIQFSGLLTFSFNLIYNLGTFTIALRIKGNTSYPNILINPHYIQMESTVPYSIRKEIFELKNMTSSPHVVSFNNVTVPSIRITNLQSKPITNHVLLEPKESKQFYIEFTSKSRIVGALYLPFQINDILGPAVFSDPSTINPKHWIKIDDAVSLKSEPIPNTLPLLKFCFVVGPPVITLSKTEFYLNNFDNIEDELVIQNETNFNQKIFFDLSEIHSNFKFTYIEVDENNTAFTDYLYEVIANSQLKFRIQYSDNKCLINRKSDVALYLKSYELKIPFTYLHIYTTYSYPEITTTKSVIVFNPIPLHTTLSKKISLLFDYHYENCEVEIFCSIQYVSAEIIEKTSLSKITQEIVVLISFTPLETCFIDDYIRIKCNCFKCVKIAVKAAAENSLLTAYHFLMDIKTEEEITSAKSVVEQLLYTQVFSYRVFYSIPEGFTSPVNDVGKAIEDNLLMVTLKQLMGGQASRFSKQLPTQTDVVDDQLRMYIINKRVLEYLNEEGVHCPTVLPERLLSYKCYKLYIRKYHSNKEDLIPEEKYKRVNTIAWLTLLIQIYKKLVVNRIARSNLNNPFNSFCVSYKPTLKSFVSEEEGCLIMWLEFHFDKERKTRWESKVIKRKKIRSFLDSFRDSLLFIAVTLSYCPYLSNILSDVFVDEDMSRTENCVHNACRIVEAWKAIRLSYDINPLKLLNSNPLEMLCLTTYLYTILPQCSAKENIAIVAELSLKGKAEITLQNPSGRTVEYNVIFFNNDQEIFTTSESVIYIDSKKTAEIKVSYFAKHVNSTSCTLLLSGESPSYAYAKNLAFTLIGKPFVTNPHINIPLQLNQFKRYDIPITIQSPFDDSYKADLYFLRSNELKSKDDLISWEAIRSKIYPIPFHIIPDEFVFDKKGRGGLNMTFHFYGVQIMKFELLLFFVNDKVGDFCANISIKVNPSVQNFETIFERTVPVHKSSCTCGTHVNKDCPRILKIHIPFVNHLLWDSYWTMVSFTQRENIIKLWGKFKGKFIGFRLLKLFNRKDDFNPLDLDSLVRQTVRYDLVSRESNFSVLQNVLIFKDTTSEKSYELLIHWNSNEEPKEESLKLIADHGCEIRFYKIVFQSE